MGRKQRQAKRRANWRLCTKCGCPIFEDERCEGCFILYGHKKSFMPKWLRRLLCKLFGHQPEKIGTCVVYRQKSKVVRCVRCEGIFYGPIGCPIDYFRFLL